MIGGNKYGQFCSHPPRDLIYKAGKYTPQKTISDNSQLKQDPHKAEETSKDNYKSKKGKVI